MSCIMACMTVVSLFSVVVLFVVGGAALFDDVIIIRNRAHPIHIAGYRGGLCHGSFQSV